jgi:hypothetical protein
MKFSINCILRSASLCGLALSAASCVSGPPYQPDGNVFINDRRPKYGYQGTNSPTADPAATEKQDRPDKPRNNDRGEDPAKLHDNDNSDNGDKPANTEPKTDKPVTDPAPTNPPVVEDPKPKPTTTNLPFGTPVIGKKGFVYSPYAPDKGMVDVSDIPSGTKVECPYTKKVFRVP